MYLSSTDIDQPDHGALVHPVESEQIKVFNGMFVGFLANQWNLSIVETIFLMVCFSLLPFDCSDGNDAPLLPATDIKIEPMVTESSASNGGYQADQCT